MADTGEQGDGGDTSEQLTGPGQARLLIQETNVGQAPDTVDNGSSSHEEAAFRGSLRSNDQFW